jgi:hypothetical protein
MPLSEGFLAEKRRERLRGLLLTPPMRTVTSRPLACRWLRSLKVPSRATSRYPEGRGRMGSESKSDLIPVLGVTTKRRHQSAAKLVDWLCRRMFNIAWITNSSPVSVLNIAW